MNDSTNQVALVTGGGTGVGRATSLQLAKRGFDIAVNYSRSQVDAEQTAQDIRELGRRAIVVQCDVARDQQAVAMIEKVRSNAHEITSSNPM